MPPRKSRQTTTTTQLSELTPATPTAQSQPPTQTDPPPKRRGPNFTPEEDEQLAKSWAVVSQDAVTSNNQKAADFWARVLDDFNQFTPGPKRDADGLSTRWKPLQQACLKFDALYNQIANNPASGTSPDDWMLNARGMYHEQVHKHFTTDRAWILLKDIPKFKKLSGKAKNGRPSHASGSQSRPPDTLSPTKPSKSNVPAGAPKSKDWERPPGIHRAKCNVTKDEYKRKKMKLLESSEKQLAKRTLEAKRANEEATQANNIQEEWVALDQEKNEMTLMFQDVNACTDEYAQAYLLAKKKSILDNLKNGRDTSNHSVQRSSRASNERTSRPPTSENEGTSRPPTSENDGNSRPPTSEKDSNDDESEEEEDKSDEGESDRKSNSDPTQTQNAVGPSQEEEFPLHPDLAFM
ncbi:hypothetical protein PTTG_10415 [Puccinia triticina 1-1 BBBD Race 1]|uniref:NAM-associated domain-containing protein n=1 Tax=Puccinia triticina (isolate 1-1 / race 1 (BBBD)) TaxID=630390 RepID=A0A0C4FB22_PUCT1|nr:hypothetical protein PTTG_10415 [Puccinia triticina 1-1 BBBD Race 1]